VTASGLDGSQRGRCVAENTVKRPGAAFRSTCSVQNAEPGVRKEGAQGDISYIELRFPCMLYTFANQYIESDLSLWSPVLRATTFQSNEHPLLLRRSELYHVVPNHIKMHLERPSACTSVGPKDVKTALEISGEERVQNFDRQPRKPHRVKPWPNASSNQP
jgi:hypothetical protein